MSRAFDVAHGGSTPNLPRTVFLWGTCRALMLVVTIGVDNSSAISVLKSVGRHHFLASNNLSMARANVALSALSIRPYGLFRQPFAPIVLIATASGPAPKFAACVRVNYRDDCGVLGCGMAGAPAGHRTGDAFGIDAGRAADGLVDGPTNRNGALASYLVT